MQVCGFQSVPHGDFDQKVLMKPVVDSVGSHMRRSRLFPLLQVIKIKAGSSLWFCPSPGYASPSGSRLLVEMCVGGTYHLKSSLTWLDKQL